MKTCFKCGIEKHLSEFHKHLGMKDGHINKCIKCVHEYKSAHLREKLKDPEWALKERRRQRIKERRRRAMGVSTPQRNEDKLKWIEKNPKKRKAHLAVSNAIRGGRLKRELCFCGNKAQAHHEDYSKPLEVLWLCTEHHNQHHNKQREKELILRSSIRERQ